MSYLDLAKRSAQPQPSGTAQRYENNESYEISAAGDLGGVAALELVGVAARIAVGIAALPVDELAALIGTYRARLAAFDAWCAAAADQDDARRLREATSRQIAALRATLAGNRQREGQP